MIKLEIKKISVFYCMQIKKCTIHECDMTYFKSQRLSSLRAFSPG